MNTRIFVFHGSDTVQSRTACLSYIQSQNGADIRSVEGKTASQTDVLSAIEPASLFSGTAIIVLNGLIAASGRKSWVKEFFRSAAGKLSDQNILVVWEGKELTKEQLSWFPGDAAVRNFPYPKTLFQFLDAIRPGNVPEMLRLYRTTLEREPAELIHSLLLSRIRQLIQLKDNVLPVRVLPWQLPRLTKQSGDFTMDQLMKFHGLLVAAEYAIKTGTTPQTLQQATESIIVQILTNKI